MATATLQCLRSTMLRFSLSSSSNQTIMRRVPPLHFRNDDVSTSGTSSSRLTSHISRPQKHIVRRALRLCRAGDVSFPERVPEENSAHTEEDSHQSWFTKWRMHAAELRAKAAKWGLSAVLAYGLFDGVTYTTFFILAFLSYEKGTGQNPAANLKALLGVVLLMWGGNNVTRPFRVAGAAALAPVIDKGLKKMQEALKLPNQAFAFMICVGVFASLCFSAVGILILSRWGR